MLTEFIWRFLTLTVCQVSVLMCSSLFLLCRPAAWVRTSQIIQTAAEISASNSYKWWCFVEEWHVFSNIQQWFAETLSANIVSWRPDRKKRRVGSARPLVQRLLTVRLLQRLNTTSLISSRRTCRCFLSWCCRLKVWPLQMFCCHVIGDFFAALNEEIAAIDGITRGEHVK